MIIELTKEEQLLLLEIIQAVNIPSQLVDKFIILRDKIKAAKDNREKIESVS